MKQFNTLMNHTVGFVDYWTRGKLQPAHISAFTLVLYAAAGWCLHQCRPLTAATLIVVSLGLDYFAERLATAQKSFALSGTLFRQVLMQLKLLVVHIGLIIFTYKHIDI